MSEKGPGCVKTRAYPQLVEQSSVPLPFQHLGPRPRCRYDVCNGAAQGAREKIDLQCLRFHTASVGSGPRPCFRKRTIRIRPRAVIHARRCRAYKRTRNPDGPSCRRGDV